MAMAHQTAVLAGNASHSCRRGRNCRQQPLLLHAARADRSEYGKRSSHFPPRLAGKLLAVPRITGVSLKPMPLVVPRAKRNGGSSRQPGKEPLLSARIMASTSLDELLALVEENSANLSPDAVSASLLRAAYLKREQGRSLSETMRDRLPEVVNQHLERHMTTRILDYDAFTLALCAHKLATIRMGRKSTFRAVEKQAINKLQDFQPRGLSSLLWAFAKANFQAPQLFEAVDDHLHSHPGLLMQFTAQDLSNLLWAFAKAGQQAPKLFKAVDFDLCANDRLLKVFKPQDFSNLLWAYATAGEQAPNLFEAVENHLNANLELMDKFIPQCFSNILWAYATSGVQAPKLFKAVESHLVSNPDMLGNFKSKELSNLLWAYATAGEKAPKLFEAVNTMHAASVFEQLDAATLKALAAAMASTELQEE